LGEVVWVLFIVLDVIESGPLGLCIVRQVESVLERSNDKYARNGMSFQRIPETYL